MTDRVPLVFHCLIMLILIALVAAVCAGIIAEHTQTTPPGALPPLGAPHQSAPRPLTERQLLDAAVTELRGLHADVGRLAALLKLQANRPVRVEQPQAREVAQALDHLRGMLAQPLVCHCQCQPAPSPVAEQPPTAPAPVRLSPPCHNRPPPDGARAQRKRCPW